MSASVLKLHSWVIKAQEAQQALQIIEQDKIPFVKVRTAFFH